MTSKGCHTFYKKHAYISHTFCFKRAGMDMIGAGRHLSLKKEMIYRILHCSHCLDRSMLLKMTFRDKSVFNTSTPQEEAATVHQCWGFCQPLTDSRDWNLRPTTVSAHRTMKETSYCVRQVSVWSHSLVLCSKLVHNSHWILFTDLFKLKNIEATQTNKKCCLIWSLRITAKINYYISFFFNVNET